MNVKCSSQDYIQRWQKKRERDTYFNFCRIYPIVKRHINTLYHNGMESTKIFKGGQPRIINKYKILRHKILKYNAAETEADSHIFPMKFMELQY